MSKPDERQSTLRAGDQTSRQGGAGAPSSKPQQQQPQSKPGQATTRQMDSRDPRKRDDDIVMNDHADHPVSRPAQSTED